MRRAALCNTNARRTRFQTLTVRPHLPSSSPPSSPPLPAARSRARFVERRMRRRVARPQMRRPALRSSQARVHRVESHGWRGAGVRSAPTRGTRPDLRARCAECAEAACARIALDSSRRACSSCARDKPTHSQRGVEVRTRACGSNGVRAPNTSVKDWAPGALMLSKPNAGRWSRESSACVLRAHREVDRSVAARASSSYVLYTSALILNIFVFD
ncbi:hypothetical protein C8R47DRAFT_531858 [Mycena vitilis]|nr:hypothetical protein C8R47DRAFT_531858 [Mycena vitilis]